MLKLFSGRPADSDQRSDIEKEVYNLLDSLKIEYNRLDHQPAFTMEICQQIDKSLGAIICKNLFLTNRQQTDFYLLMMPADKVFKTKFLSKALGISRLSFASGETMEKLMGTTPGSASVLGLMNDKEGRVSLVIDEEVLKEEYFGCHPCINTSSLRLSTKDLTEKILPHINHSFKVVTLPESDEDIN